MITDHKGRFDQAATCAAHMPSFLAKTGFCNPVSPKGNFQSAFDTELQMFPWLIERSERMRNFNDLMEGQKMTRVDWFEVCDAEKVLALNENSEQGKDKVLLVDIGGGRGDDLVAFQRKYPQAEGKLILQDLPPVLNDIKDLDVGVEKMPHDFFAPQPVKGGFSISVAVLGI